MRSKSKKLRREDAMALEKLTRATLTQIEDGASNTTPEDKQPLAKFGLDSVDCPICGNTGTIMRKDENGILWGRECKCMAQRRSKKWIVRSGLSDLLDRYTFDAYQMPDAKRKNIRQIAEAFCKADVGWFFIAGRPGSGKTHICTAICGELLKSAEVRYMLWRDEIVKIKADVTDSAAYEKDLRPFKTVPVLYIDDFLKGKVTDADLNAAFEIINSRYNDKSKRTIISSELRIPKILDLDEALGSRIYERSKSFCADAPDENWRLHSE
jgi:DNA replication protein DnaC